MRALVIVHARAGILVGDCPTSILTQPVKLRREQRTPSEVIDDPGMVHCQPIVQNPTHALAKAHITFAILNEGWQTTRTVSPVAIDLFNTLLTEELNWNTSVRNAFLNDTKREVVNRISSKEVIRTAVSCPHHGRQRQYELDNCGQCVPCIIRNIAILTSRFDIPTQDLSICDWGTVDFEARELPDVTPYELPHRNDRDTFLLALGEIAHLCRLLREEQASTVVTEHPQLASNQIYSLHSRFAVEFTQAFKELAEENPSVKAIL